MADISQRNKQKQELATIGYSLGFIDDRAPKMTFYRHKPDLNVEGLVVSEVGSALHNLPSSPDYVLKMSRMGRFAWLPGGDCTCRWCVERKAIATVNAKEEVKSVPVEKTETPEASTEFADVVVEVQLGVTITVPNDILITVVAGL